MQIEGCSLKNKVQVMGLVTYGLVCHLCQTQNHNKQLTGSNLLTLSDGSLVSSSIGMALSLQVGCICFNCQTWPAMIHNWWTPCCKLLMDEYCCPKGKTIGFIEEYAELSWTPWIAIGLLETCTTFIGFLDLSWWRVVIGHWYYFELFTQFPGRFWLTSLNLL